MVLDQDLRRVFDISTYEAVCWPSFALEIFYASSDGMTCYTCDCISINAICILATKSGGTKDITSPTSKNGRDMSPHPPLKLGP